MGDSEGVGGEGVGVGEGEGKERRDLVGKASSHRSPFDPFFRSCSLPLSNGMGVGRGVDCLVVVVGGWGASDPSEVWAHHEREEVSSRRGHGSV